MSNKKGPLKRLLDIELTLPETNSKFAPENRVFAPKGNSSEPTNPSDFLVRSVSSREIMTTRHLGTHQDSGAPKGPLLGPGHGGIWFPAWRMGSHDLDTWLITMVIVFVP